MAEPILTTVVERSRDSHISAEVAYQRLKDIIIRGAFRQTRK
jgi:hypothetical protein